MAFQVEELLSSISDSLGKADVSEISRLYKTPIHTSIESSSADIFSFFDYYPESVAIVLDISESSVRDLALTSEGLTSTLLTAVNATASDEATAAAIYGLVVDTPASFTSALTVQLRTRDDFEEEANLDSVGTMKVSVTLQADVAPGTDVSAVVLKLEAMGYTVEVHDQFGYIESLAPNTEESTVTVIRRDTDSSNQFLWQSMFAAVVVLLSLIGCGLCYKRSEDTRQQRATNAAKLYAHQTQKAAKQLEFIEDPNPTSYTQEQQY